VSVSEVASKRSSSHHSDSLVVDDVFDVLDIYERQHDCRRYEEARGRMERRSDRIDVTLIKGQASKQMQR
jgi:hypothetical protein